ncbi:MAG: DUF6788 family protein [Candidatus Eisenbacteria bacterium]|nr:DUF6788 family protein [Candidatus Eisenbacteria bacterium]
MRQRTKELRRVISGMDYVASGTLHTRTKVCGKKNCRCADDPAARHGPYHEWSRRQNGRLVHSVITEQQAALFVRAIDNHREILTLLALWERETAAELLQAPPGPKTPNHRKSKN